jgi:hypothetical protein
MFGDLAEMREDDLLQKCQLVECVAGLKVEYAHEKGPYPNILG